jgi:hypothetical protein
MYKMPYSHRGFRVLFKTFISGTVHTLMTYFVFRSSYYGKQDYF